MSKFREQYVAAHKAITPLLTRAQKIAEKRGEDPSGSARYRNFLDAYVQNSMQAARLPAILAARRAGRTTAEEDDAAWQAQLAALPTALADAKRMVDEAEAGKGPLVTAVSFPSIEHRKHIETALAPVPAALAPQAAAAKAAAALGMSKLGEALAGYRVAPTAHPPEVARAAPAPVPAALAPQAVAAAEARKVAIARADADAEREAAIPIAGGAGVPFVSADPAVMSQAELLRFMHDPYEHAEHRFGAGLERAATEAAAAARAPTALPKRAPMPPASSPEAARTGGVPASVEANFSYGPGWEAGPEGIRRRTVEHAVTNYNNEMADIPNKYRGPRLAPITSSHIKANKLLNRTFEDPTYKEMFESASEQAHNAMTKDHLAEVRGGLAASRASILPEIEAHMDPYNRIVTEALERSARKQFEKVTLPRIIGNYISHGAHGARAMNFAEEMARENFEKDLRDQMASVLYRGHESAVGIAERHKARHLAAAHAHAAIGGADEARRLDAARTIGALSHDEQATHRSNADVLQQLGTQKQAYAQQALNIPYQEYLDSKHEPIEAFDRLYNYVHRMPSSNVAQIRTNTGVPGVPQPSPFTTLGGAGLGLLGLMNQRGAGNRGGFASGGSVSYIPEQIDMMNRMRQHATQLEGSNSHPMWGYLANLGAGIASSRNPKVMGAIGESIPHAHEGFNEVANRNDNNQARALAIRQAVVDSQLAQQEREERRTMLERDYQLKKLKTSAYINHLNASGTGGQGKGLPYNAKTKKDFDSYLASLTHQAEENKERKHLYGRMKDNIQFLESSKSLFGAGAPGGLIARIANNDQSPFQNLARKYYSEDQLAAIDQIAKDNKEAATRALADLGPNVRASVPLERQLAAAQPNASIATKTGLNITTEKGASSGKKEALAEAAKLVFQERGNRVEAEKVAKYVVKKYGTSDDAIEHYPEIIEDLLEQREPSYTPGEAVETEVNYKSNDASSGLKSFSKEEKLDYLKRKGKLK